MDFNDLPVMLKVFIRHPLQIPSKVIKYNISVNSLGL